MSGREPGSFPDRFNAPSLPGRARRVTSPAAGHMFGHRRPKPAVSPGGFAVTEPSSPYHPPNGPRSCGKGGQRSDRPPLPSPPAHAAQCLQLRRRPWPTRYPRHPGMARSPQHPAHHTLTNTPVQELLAAGGLGFAIKADLASSSRISSRRGRTPRSRPAAAPNPRLARLPERFEAEAQPDAWASGCLIPGTARPGRAQAPRTALYTSLSNCPNSCSTSTSAKGSSWVRITPATRRLGSIQK